MTQKLALSEKIGYGLGDMAANFVFQAIMALQLDFYTRTYGLTAGQAATLFLVVGLGSAVFNPVMGVIADRTNTRWGKFRPWLLWTAVPFGVIGVLTFTTPGGSPGSKLVYAYVTYSLLRIVYAVNNVPYAALTGVMTSDPDERTSIASWRQIFANSAGFIVTSLAVPMVTLFGGSNSAKGYQWTMGTFCVIGAILFVVAFASTKERIQPAAKQKSNLIEDLGGLLKNGPWIALFLATLFYFIALAMRGGVMLPFFTFNAGNRDLYSWFNGFGLASLLIGVTFSTKLSRVFGKRNLFLGSMLLTTAFNMALYLLPANSAAVLVASEVVRQFSFGISCPVLWAMMGDVADWGEWKTGRRATGTVTSAVVFALWAGLSLGGWISGLLLEHSGYDAQAAQQTPASLSGILNVASIFSGLAFLAVAICLIFYPMTQAKTRQMADELAERRRKLATE
jgi:glycoside/pentoside/hexuronide:cation symporter, GPH family